MEVDENHRNGEKYNDVDGVSLPKDVLEEILVYLPVPSLLRFKSVSKTWRKIIERSDFVLRHATFDGNHLASAKLGAFIFEGRKGRPSLVYKPHYYVRYGEEFEVVESLGLPPFFSDEEDEEKVEPPLHEVHNVGSCPDEEFDNVDQDSDDEEEEEEKEEEWEWDEEPTQHEGYMTGFCQGKEFLFINGMRVPVLSNDSEEEAPPPPPPEVHMVSSCHGVICLHDQTYNDVALWNPATKQFRFLPKSLEFHELGSYGEAFVAFGYDTENKDYKVLMVTSYEPYETPYKGDWIRRAQVYSLSHDSWRCIDVDPHIECVTCLRLNQGRFLNGHFIFVEEKRCGQGSCYLMLKYDFSKEIFTSIDLPGGGIPRLDIIGDKIVCFLQKGDWYFEAWMLNDCSTNERWTKLYRFGPHRYLFDSPMAVSKNGEFGFIQVAGSDMWICNLVTEEVKDIQFEPSTFVQVHKADVYKWSLVSIS